MCDVGIRNDFRPAGNWPAPEMFCVHPQNFQVFACVLTVSQRPHKICNSYTLLRQHLWEYPFTPYLYAFPIECISTCA